jgi:DNA primase
MPRTAEYNHDQTVAQLEKNLERLLALTQATTTIARKMDRNEPSELTAGMVKNFRDTQAFLLDILSNVVYTDD